MKCLLCLPIIATQSWLGGSSTAPPPRRLQQLSSEMPPQKKKKIKATRQFSFPKQTRETQSCGVPRDLLSPDTHTHTHTQGWDHSCCPSVGSTLCISLGTKPSSLLMPYPACGCYEPATSLVWKQSLKTAKDSN